MQVTLNFLSPTKKALLKTGFAFAFAQSMLLVVFVAVIFSSGLLLSLRMMLDDISTTITQQASGSDRDSTALNEEIKTVNDYLIRQDGYRKGYNDWASTLTSLTTMASAGIQLKLIHVDTGGIVTFSGKARDRQDVLNLEAKLRNSKVFFNVIAPLSNIMQQHDVDFEFSMQMTNPPVLPSYGDTSKTKHPIKNF